MDSNGSAPAQDDGDPRDDQPVGATPLAGPAGAELTGANPADANPADARAADGRRATRPATASLPDGAGLPGTASQGIAGLPGTSSAGLPPAPVPPPATPVPPPATPVPPPEPTLALRPTDDRPAHLFGYLAVYTLLRLALVAALTAVLAIFMPLIVALLFAIIVQLPLSWLLFAGPRRRVNEAMARSTAQRRAERERLQAALSGDEPSA